MMYFSILCILILSSVNVFSESVEFVEFRNLITELKEEMAALRKVRIEDSETIRSLQDKVHRYVPLGKLTESDASVGNSKESLAKDSTSSFVGATKSKTERETEAEYLHQELVQLKTQIANINQQKAEQVTLSSSGVAVRWLQRAVEGLRREMREMAASMNTSATLAEKQQTTTNFALLRSDVVALGHRMDTVRVDRERNAALIKQLRLDVDEIRQRLQEFALGQQKLLIEVDTLKEELQEQILLSNAKTLLSGSSTKQFEDGHLRNAGGKEHHKFRHDHWKIEVSHLQETVNNLYFTHTDLTKRLQVLINHQASQALKIKTLEKVLNRNEPRNEEQTITNQRLNDLETLVNKTELQTLDMQSSINNITTTGIKKLHGSTVQLFKALERLESNYDKSTDDIRKEISKLDSNLSQTQSNVDELRDSGRSSKQVISNIKDDVNTLQSDVTNNRARMLLLQNALLNRSIYENVFQGQDAKISDIEFQIQSLSDDVDAEKVEMEVLHRQLAEKVDDKKFRTYESEQQKVRESILQFKEDIPKIRRHQDYMKEELEKFSLELPQDCAGNSSLEDTFRRRSGTFLIHPLTSSSNSMAIKVFCDMESSGGYWTVIQKRSKGDQNFNRDWKTYKNGFGDVGSTDFWLGNEIIHILTANKDYTLRIDMWDILGKYIYAEYGAFRVLSEADNYRLVLSEYRGNASDAMSYHNGMSFSTPDRDNDASLATHCADFYSSGWWYNHCQYVNINGRFNTGMTWYDIDGQEWSELTRVEMKIKPRTLFSS